MGRGTGVCQGSACPAEHGAGGAAASQKLRGFGVWNGVAVPAFPTGPLQAPPCASQEHSPCTPTCIKPTCIEPPDPAPTASASHTDHPSVTPRVPFWAHCLEHRPPAFFTRRLLKFLLGPQKWLAPPPGSPPVVPVPRGALFSCLPWPLCPPTSAQIPLCYVCLWADVGPKPVYTPCPPAPAPRAHSGAWGPCERD